MRENEYQPRLIQKLERLFPGCVILKNDSSYLQGVPDLLVLFGNRWAMLEVKADETSKVQVNQPYWVDTFNQMSFSAFIYPSNEQEVLRGLEQAFSDRGHTCLPERL